MEEKEDNDGWRERERETKTTSTKKRRKTKREKVPGHELVNTSVASIWKHCVQCFVVFLDIYYIFLKLVTFYFNGSEFKVSYLSRQ